MSGWFFGIAGLVLLFAGIAALASHDYIAAGVLLGLFLSMPLMREVLR